jgi:hypothetical protein
VPSTEAKPLQVGEAWSQALAKAKEWNKEAVLVSVVAGPMKGNAVLDTTQGASVKFELGLPAKGSAPTNPIVGDERFVWSMDATGIHSAPIKGSRSSRAASEPGCPYDDAIAKGIAAGLSRDREFLLRYEYSTEREKSVWVLQAMDDPKFVRILDGYSCAILTR